MPRDKYPQNPAPGAPVVVELATTRRRLAGLLYESLLLLGVLGLTFMLPYIIMGFLWHFTPPGWFLRLHVLAVCGVYFVWFWHQRGQTLAMRTWGLQVVCAADGRNPSWQRACLRYALAWPSLMCGGIGLFWALIDLDSLFLHDRLAGTRVVSLPPQNR
ncbi:MAG: RDD family protein [Azoarcus sp.]|nr:RDD family protein [Azoarcus sp.]